MLAGDFARNLRKLNPELRIFCGNDDTKPAGLFFVRKGEYRDICGVDKNIVPEFKVGLWDGTIIKQGWRDVLMLLVTKKMINKFKAERLFQTTLNYWSPFTFAIDAEHDPLVIKRNKMFEASKYGEVIDTRDFAQLSVDRKRRAEGRL